MDSAAEIVPFQARRYALVPIAQVKVIDSRNRDKEQFDMNVASIDHVGLIVYPLGDSATTTLSVRTMSSGPSWKSWRRSFDAPTFGNGSGGS